MFIIPRSKSLVFFIYSDRWEKERREMKRMHKIPDYSAQLEGVVNSLAGKGADDRIIKRQIISGVHVASVFMEPVTHHTNGEVGAQDKTAKDAGDGAAKYAAKKTSQLARRREATLPEKGKGKEKETEREK